MLSRDSCLCLSGEEPISTRCLCAFLVTHGVPKSLSETPRSPKAAAQGGWGSRSPGRWKGHGWERAHSPLERDSQPLPTRVPKALPSARPPSRACSSPGRSGVVLGQIPSSAPPDQPPLRQGPSQLRDPFLESCPLFPLAECPPRLVWCLQLWSPPPAPGRHHPAQVSFPRAPSPAQGNRDGSTGLPHPESQDALPSSGPAQLLPPFPAPQPTQCPPERLQLGEGSSIPSSAAACHGQRAQPGNVVAAGGGAVWTQAPLCPA